MIAIEQKQQPSLENDQHIVHQLLDMLQQLCGCSPIHIDDDIFTLGGDALLILELVRWVNDTYSTALTPKLLSQNSTPARLTQWLGKNG